MLISLCVLACGHNGQPSGSAANSAKTKTSGRDAGAKDTTPQDAGSQDASAAPVTGADDTAQADAGADPNTAPTHDAGSDAGHTRPKCASGQMPCNGRCVTVIAPTLDDIHARIIAGTCALASSCHTGVSPKEGLDLTSADSMFRYVGMASKQFPTLSIIEAGNPHNSYLIHKLRGMGLAATASSGVPATQMPPPPTTPLCDERIQVIETWIRNGALR